MSAQPTVFLVDDDHAYRQSLKFLLESADLDVEDYPSAEGFLKAYQPDRRGCLVLDIRMSGMSGLELQERLADRHVGIPVIFISGHGDVPMSVKAMKSGALDFLEKPFEDAVLIERIKEAFKRDWAQRDKRAKLAQSEERFATLTARERDVMKLIVAGHSNREIAARLNLSHRTVEVHRARIMTKTGCDSLPELIGLAAVCGMVERRV